LELEGKERREKQIIERRERERGKGPHVDSA